MAERLNRAEEVRRERRRKPGSVAISGIKLTVDESKLDRDKFHYRFVNDTPGRIRQLTAQDYDIAPEGAKEDSNSLGSVSSVQAGIDDDGKPFNTVLMRKYRDWYEADQKEKQRPLDEMDEAIRRGAVNHAGNKDSRGEGGFYTPDGGNKIETRSTR